MNTPWRIWAAGILLAMLAGCNQRYPAIGQIERNDPALDQLVPRGAKIEKLASGFKWAEGPVWVGDGLLFSDVPSNVIHKWTDGGGVTEFIRPSGFTGHDPRGGESGSNGLTLDPDGKLTACQHGDRRVARMEKDRGWVTITDNFEARRFNSPNDLVFSSKGDLYFTDPPYGLEKGPTDPKREMAWCGVYRVAPNGRITLLTRDLTFPNGLALSPDEKTLYVAVSDPKRPIVMAYDVTAEGNIANGRVFFDAAKLAAEGRPGLPDGMKVDDKGNVFCTGPGGVLVISPEGKLLGSLILDQPTANCAWGDDGSTLYITSNHDICRIKLSTRGRMPGK